MNRFAEKVALVTGGASGIGLATVKRLSNEGAIVIVLDRDEAAWENVSKSSWAKGRELFFYRTNLTSDGEILSAVKQAVAELGALDVLINNVGGTTSELFMTTPMDRWRADVELNLNAQASMIHAALPFLCDGDAGVIVNVASINAMMSLGNPAYSAAKAGLISLTRSLAIELAPDGVRVNAVVPGTVRTEAWEFRIAKNPEMFDTVRSWYPGEFIGEPEDIAAAIAFLAAPEARYVNGASLVVDGGLTAGNHKMIADIIVT